MHRALKGILAVATFLVLLPAVSSAQVGQVAGTVRDTSGAVMPGVLVEVTSPALIEKVRSTTTDGSGSIESPTCPSAPIPSTFTLEGFSKQQQNNVVLTTGFTAPVNATMAVGQLADTVTVSRRGADGRRAERASGRDVCRRGHSRSADDAQHPQHPDADAGPHRHRPGRRLRRRRRRLVQQQHLQPERAHRQPTTPTAATQGRVMVDGTIINTGGGAGIMGMTGGYVADVANAQEVNVQISGALGESETGGASINIIPRTGGNTFAGNYFMTYTQGRLRHGWRAARWWVVRRFVVLQEQRQVIPRSTTAIRSSATTTRRGRSAGRSSATACGSSRWRGPGRRTRGAGSDDRIWDNKNAGIWGQNYQAGSVDSGRCS